MNIEENLNNNIGLEDIKELETIYSESWIPATADIEIFKDLPDTLFEGDEMEKKETSPSPSSPIPAPTSPAVVEAVSVKTETTDFDLIKYIIFGDVSSNEDDENFSDVYWRLNSLHRTLIYHWRRWKKSQCQASSKLRT